MRPSAPRWQSLSCCWGYRYWHRRSGQWHRLSAAISKAACIPTSTITYAIPPTKTRTNISAATRQVHFARQRFAELDRDANGYLDRTDLGKWGKRGRYRGLHQLGGQLFLRMDLNEDGVVSVEEAVAAELERQQAIDQNNDGLVSAKEYREHKRLRHLSRADRFFQHADINNDDLLSRQEMQSAVQKMRERRDYWGVGASWADDD